jgi:hypothetical protein
MKRFWFDVLLYAVLLSAWAYAGCFDQSPPKNTKFIYQEF